jgi:hypothetical protein
MARLFDIARFVLKYGKSSEHIIQTLDKSDKGMGFIANCEPNGGFSEGTVFHFRDRKTKEIMKCEIRWIKKYCIFGYKWLRAGVRLINEEQEYKHA